MSPHEITDEWPSELSLDDQAGPAPVIARAKADDMIFAALDQAGFSDEVVDQRPSGAGRSSYTPKPGLATRSLAAAAVLACLSLGSASAAVLWWGRTRHDRPAAEEPRAVPHTARKPVVTAPVSAPAAEGKAAPAVEPAPAAEVEAPRHTPRAPEDWLVEGNRLRAARRWNKADDAYLQAAEHAPHSQTAYVAKVASAGVRLEHLHDARGALAGYQRALALKPDGPLAEEIHWGIAECYRALGKRALEQEALLLFVQKHPRSPLLAQAQARLD